MRWTISGYTLVLAALLVTASRLGDMRGQRTLFAVVPLALAGTALRLTRPRPAAAVAA
ncbi:hypothetical protein ACH41H_38715 [Streptomyces sp. NPDC020800]|uniref:hypothetical protein n=1 Tax=Streptomyces sp. NPDC020800 TaxID=3365092 RepID=UPI00378CD8DC